jgi:hypothetical protein
MKIQKISNLDEKHILTAMIVDDKVLSRLYTKYEPNLFKTKWANLISKWCMIYFKKYERAPKNNIESLFYKWTKSAKDIDTIDLIAAFLKTLSDDYDSLSKESNTEYILDLCGNYFNHNKLEELSENITDYLSSNEIDKAMKELNDFKKIEIGTGAGIDLFNDKEVIKNAFLKSNDILFKYPSDLGSFFDVSLQRENFISFMGPEKSGKSFWLLDLAYRALVQNKKVAFFEAGDMGQSQVVRRIMCRVAKTPLKPKTINIPTSFYYAANGIVQTQTKKKIFNKGLTHNKATRVSELFLSKKLNNQPLFKLFCYPSDTLSVDMIRNLLEEYAVQESWIPDVIVIDYADILNMNYYGLEGRDRINTTWVKLRSLAQTYHSLVVTATQSDANSYETKILNKANFTEDKRKISHVSGMVGINVNDTEKKQGITRLNWIVRREDEYVVSACCLCAGNLSIANPAIISEMGLI